MMFIDILQHAVGIGSMTSDDDKCNIVRQQGQCLYSLQDVFSCLYGAYIEDVTLRQLINGAYLRTLLISYIGTETRGKTLIDDGYLTFVDIAIIQDITLGTLANGNNM